MDISGSTTQPLAVKRFDRKEYDRLNYLRRKLEKQTNAKSFFKKDSGQQYTMIRRNNILKSLAENERKAAAFREYLNSQQNI